MSYPQQLHIAQLGEKVLKSHALAVVEFDDNLQEFVDRLTAKMQEAGGIGIAAPQVFCSRQIMIIASRPNKRYPNAPDMSPLLMINPQITGQSQYQESDWEGCLSVPGIRGQVPRADWVEVRWQNLLGEFASRRF